MQRAVVFTSLLTANLSTAFRPSVPPQVLSPYRRVRHRNTITAGATKLTMVDKWIGARENLGSSEAITAGSVTFGGVYYSNGNLYWLEGRPQEGGRNVMRRYAPDDPNRCERNGVDVSPKESNVGTRVPYGNGAVAMRGKNIVYSDLATQRLCRLLDDGISKPIVIPDDEGGRRYRYADGALSYNSKVIYCVREDHKHQENVVNEIVSIDVRDGYTKVLATGNDFYAHPRVSSNGKKLAYITWNRPSMPRDSTELRVTDVYSAKSNESCDHKLIGGGDGDTSVLQPTYQGGRLHYISNRSGHYNIYRAGFEGSILPMEADFGGPAPGRRLGRQGFLFVPGKDGRLVAQYNKDGRSVMLTANVSDGRAPATDVKEFSGDKDGLPMLFGEVVAGEDSDLYFIGGSPSTSPSIYRWNAESKNEATILSCSSD